MGVGMDLQFKPHEYGINDEGIKNGNVEILKYTTFSANGAYFPTDHHELKLIPIFGKMGAGKTELGKKITAETVRIFQEAGFECEYYQTRDLIALMEYLNKPENIGNRKKVLIILFDDILNQSGLSSLNTFSQSNKDLEVLTSVLRHYLNNELNNGGKPDPHVQNGLCLLFYMCQDVHRLSTFVRRNATLIIYKSFYREVKNELSTDQEEYLKRITTLSDQSVYSARAFSLAVDSNGNAMKLFYPLTQDFTIPELTPVNERLVRKFAELIELLKNVYNEKMKGKIFTSYVEHWGEKNQIDISSQDISRVEKKIIYWWNYERPPSEEQEKPKKPYIRKDRVRHRVNHPRYPNILNIPLDNDQKG